MAHKKGEGKVKNGRDSHSKRLGIKIFGGEVANPGNIILRQRGTNYHPGKGVDMGKDHTIFAVIEGSVKFSKGKNDRRFVHVVAPVAVA
ncbi:MAG: rpmA [Bacteroidota bacterium]|nr:rpmA [Bacteroidota bacterium]